MKGVRQTMSKKDDKPMLSALMAGLREIIKKEERVHLSDLAAHLGKTWSQTHEWVVKEKVKPNGEVALAMLQFLARHDCTAIAALMLKED